MYTRHAVVGTVLGDVTIVATGEAVVGLYFPHHWHRPAQDTFGVPVPIADDELLLRAATQVGEYLAGDRTGFDLPVATAGDPFQEQVWSLLREIPRGETTTYGAIAVQLGDKALAQRVGQAVGRNPLCVIVPCHRVVGADGGLTGYAGGIPRKKYLLELEEPAEVKAARLF
ncbi:methylated-DNA--[protein]-cysteine S-methyltransferase [Lentzea sp. NPDC059081]|uniref:methylated-DNA--[protein]-cysteine S-methyltransferase n=1 Tax=Lentzea sp. NPDC059081 TaxID=3346719 RepID=UPI0036A0ED6C